MTFLLVLGTLAIGSGLVAALRQATARHNNAGPLELGGREFWKHQDRTL